MTRTDYAHRANRPADRDDLRHAASEALACLILVGFLAVVFFMLRGV